MLTAVANSAFRRKPCLNGMCLVKPKYTAITTITISTIPARTGFERCSSIDRHALLAAPQARAAHLPFPLALPGLLLALRRRRGEAERLERRFRVLFAGQVRLRGS